MLRTSATVCVATLAISAASTHAQTLRGSSVSMDRQHRIALDHDYTFLAKSGDVDRFIQLGLLVPVKGGTNYEIHAVSFPYARPAVRTFVERLSGQYRAACGEKLVVTSLTRPTTRQPRNASDISVHPAGMAVDLRISNKSSCRRWLESTLLSLEKSGVVDATRERNPAHYHIAVFPSQYTAYVERLSSRTATRLASTSSAPASSVAAESQESGPSVNGPSAVTYRVANGESLWSIARAHGTTVAELKALNGLGSSSIRAGQTLTIAEAPSSDATPEATAAEETASDDTADATPATTEDGPATATYRVSRGDTLWSIARAHDTTVAELQALNDLGSSRIKAGQILTVPVR